MNDNKYNFDTPLVLDLTIAKQVFIAQALDAITDGVVGLRDGTMDVKKATDAIGQGTMTLSIVLMMATPAPGRTSEVSNDPK